RATCTSHPYPAPFGSAQPAGTDAGPISAGQTRAAAIAAGDLDVFTFDATAGGSIILSFADTSANAFYPLVELFGPTGKQLTYSSSRVGSAVARFNYAA